METKKLIVEQSSKPQHLIFYDGQCGLCDSAVQFVLSVDKHQQFAFAPLQGLTAQRYLAKLSKELKGIDSIILVKNFHSENPRTYVMSRAVFGICWLLGGWWTFLGWPVFLPSVLFDWGYRIVASNRHKFFPGTQCFLPPKNQQERFLP